MATDDERREVASECRERAYREEFSGKAVARAIGTFTSGTTRYDHDAWYRLADLIEPSCDREALLALAREMDHPIRQAVWNKTGGVRRGHIMAEYARRIREACGVVA